MNLRVLFFINLCGLAALLVCLDLIVILLGSHYEPLRTLFILMLLCSSLSAPGLSGGMILSSMGKQRYAFWVYVGQVSFFVVLFLLLWPQWQLLGAVVANGLSNFLGSVILLVIAKRYTGLRFPIFKNYGVFVLAGVAAAASAIYVHADLGMMLPIIAIAVGIMVLASGYTISECKQLAACFVPSADR